MGRNETDRLTPGACGRARGRSSVVIGLIWSKQRELMKNRGRNCPGSVQSPLSTQQPVLW